MPKLLNLTSKKIIKILERHGFELDRTTGSHFVFYHPQKKNRVTVPYHTKDLPKETLLTILKQADLSKNDLLDL